MPTAEIWEEPYNITAIAAGCMEPNTTNLGNLSTFECMRSVPGDTIVEATAAMRADPRFGGFLFIPSIDGDLIPDRPWTMLKDGRFNTKIPYITGATLDEGTWTTPTFVNSTEMLAMLLQIYSPITIPDDVIWRILDRYPNDPAKGSPFHTGNETFGLDQACVRLRASSPQVQAGLGRCRRHVLSLPPAQVPPPLQRLRQRQHVELRVPRHRPRHAPLPRQAALVRRALHLWRRAPGEQLHRRGREDGPDHDGLLVRGGTV
jgi:hypothetical protein